MIDLAEVAGVTFKFNEKVWDVDLPTATLIRAIPRKVSGKPIITTLFLAVTAPFPGFGTKCNAGVGLIILRISWM